MEGRLKFFYWKNLRNEEVDFVVQDGITITHLMQVCADPSDPKVHAREIRALLKAGESLRCTSLFVVTTDAEKSENSSIITQILPILQSCFDHRPC